MIVCIVSAMLVGLKFLVARDERLAREDYGPYFAWVYKRKA